MDVSASFGAKQYLGSRPATQPKKTLDGLSELSRVGKSFVQTLQQSETAAFSAANGQADTHALVQALVQSELAVETAVTVRNKVVEAYQEILRMSV